MKLTIKQIKKILNNWEIGNVKEIKKTDKGVVNHNWIIKTSNGKYVLRGLPEDRKLKGLMYELKYIDYFDKERFNYKLPKAVKTKKGTEVIRYGKNYVWMYNFIEGNVKDTFGKAELREMGKMIAKYHLILERINMRNGAGKSEPYVKNLILKESKTFKENISKLRRKTKGDKTYLQEIEKLIPILRKIESNEYRKLKQYPIHRDLNPENVLWSGKKLVGIIDFENVSTLNEPLIKDVSVVLQLGCSKDGEKLDLSKAKYFIKEYKKFRKLSSKEIELLPLIITAAYIEDFSYAYWMLKNDPDRAKLYRLKKYSLASQWYWNNRDKLIKTLS